MTIDRRLRNLEIVYRRREATRQVPDSGFDAGKLSSCEQYEMALLLERVEGRPDAPTPFARWDGLEALCTCALQRLRDLTAKAHGLPPAPSPWSGPCREPECIANRVEEEVDPCRRALAEHTAWMAARQR